MENITVDGSPVPCSMLKESVRRILDTHLGIVRIEPAMKPRQQIDPETLEIARAECRGSVQERRLTAKSLE